MLLLILASSLQFVSPAPWDKNTCGKGESCVPLWECKTKFKSFLDLLNNACAPGKVCCEKAGNPCDILPEPSFPMTPDNGLCYKPLSQGPCLPGYWLTAQETSPGSLHGHPIIKFTKTLACTRKPCKEDNEILYNGLCVDGSDDGPACPSLDPEWPGQEWELLPSGRATCVCKEGFLPVQRKNPKDELQCVAPFTKSLCPEHQMVSDMNGVAVCIPNPCGDSDLSLPHPNSIQRDFNITSINQQPFHSKALSCHSTLFLMSDFCKTELDPEMVDDDGISLLKCRDEVEDMDMAGGIKNCRKGLVWNEEKCVYKFRG